MPESLDKLLQEVKLALPAYSYQLVQAPIPLILVRKDLFSGAEISLTKGKVKVSYTMPSWRSVMNMSENVLVVLLIRLLVKDAFEPMQQVLGYLRSRYPTVVLHLSSSAY